MRGDCWIVVGARRLGSGATAPGVEESLREGRTDGPEAARPAEPVGTLRAGESGGSAKSHGGEIRRAGDADLLVCLGDSTLCRGDDRTALQEVRRQTNPNAGVLAVEERH